MRSDHILVEKQPPKSIIWTALMILTLGVGMAIFYETAGKRKYCDLTDPAKVRENKLEKIGI